MGEDLAERLSGHTEVRSENVWRRMGEPVGDQQSVVFRLFAIIEGKEELASVRSKAL